MRCNDDDDDDDDDDPDEHSRDRARRLPHPPEAGTFAHLHNLELSLLHWVGKEKSRRCAGTQENVKSRLEALFKAYAQPLVRFVRKEVKEASPSPDAASSVALMRLWAALAQPVIGERPRPRTNHSPQTFCPARAGHSLMCQLPWLLPLYAVIASACGPLCTCGCTAVSHCVVRTGADIDRRTLPDCPPLALRRCRHARALQKVRRGAAPRRRRRALRLLACLLGRRHGGDGRRAGRRGGLPQGHGVGQPRGLRFARR